MAISSTLKAMLPASLYRRLRELRSRRNWGNYETLYEAHARRTPPAESVGDGDYDLIGRKELGVLLMEGLKPSDALVDFGCGTGRLAVHAIPRLDEIGCYIGIGISRTMLAHARKLVDERVPSRSCSVEFLHQTTPNFALPDKSIDMVCAFSVFTHMEHEDTYRYLRQVRMIIKDVGLFIYSCLPLEIALARQVFEESASVGLVDRRAGVRNVTTSRELMDTIARMAGWEPVRWYMGVEPDIRLPDSSEMVTHRQSYCVLGPVRDMGTHGR
jgi:ubiquinone/menaquinone biosynthesis C-methylase UbiE